ncbi:MAG: sel1 repeat family protein [Gemmatimonadales bacterium]|nr:MAG: sel1 repeat family protein [Gemmatimonadales bacterium]
MKITAKASLVALVLSLGFAAPISADENEVALAAFERGDYATALRHWRPLAEQGDAKAQSNLGGMYQEGQGVPQDYAEAVKWYRKAAAQGNPFAQLNLGHMYAAGHGVPQDYAEALQWYRNLAERGDAYAQANLANMYYFGQGVPQDYVEAHKWYELAAGNVSGSETEDRDRVATYHDNLAKKMTDAQIAEAQNLAREWKPKVEGGGD